MGGSSLVFLACRSLVFILISIYRPICYLSAGEYSIDVDLFNTKSCLNYKVKGKVKGAYSSS